MTSITATQDDITNFGGDAIVNAANSRLEGGGGVDGAIHRAGGPSILEECRHWVATNGLLPTGEAVVTGAGNLHCDVVIHTVGPIWAEHDDQTAHRLLASCYRNSLQLAAERECKSIAFPNISTGVYGFPKEPAARTAVSTVMARIEENPVLDEIVFVCFDKDNLEIYSELLEP
jgi:O-acetyl-ADP-ribose deacetylase (regulator of RNase III)